MMYYELTNPNKGVYIMDYSIDNGKNQTAPFSKGELIRACQMIKHLADEHGVTEAEVRSDLLEAMKAGRNNPDPRVKEKWAAFHYAGEYPTADEFLAWVLSLATKIKY